MTVSVPVALRPRPRRRRRHRRPARHAGGDGGVHPRRQRRRRRDRRQRRHRRHGAAPVRDGRRPVRPRPRARTAASPRSTPAAGPGSGADADAAAGRAATRRCRCATTSAPSPCPAASTAGCALHERFGRLDLATVLAPAIRLAAFGFPASPLLVGSLGLLDDDARAPLRRAGRRRPTDAGAPVRRPGVALALQAIVAGGRSAFYGGAFGEGLLALGAGYFTRRRPRPRPGRLGRAAARRRRFGVELSTIGPNSQGYLALGAARLLDARRRARRSRRPAVGPPARRGGGDRRRSTVPTCSTRTPTARPCSPPIDGPGRPRRPRSGPAAARWRRPPATRRTCARPTTPGMAVSLIQSNAAGLRVVARRADDRHQPAQPRPRVQPRAGPPRRVPARARGRRTRCARRWPPATASWPPCSARWAATPSRRSCSRSPPACSPHGASPADAVGAPRWVLRGAGDRVRHVDQRRPADRRRRGPRPAGVAHRARSSAVTPSTSPRRSTPASATPTPSSSSRAARSPPPPTHAPASAARPAI